MHHYSLQERGHSLLQQEEPRFIFPAEFSKQVWPILILITDKAFHFKLPGNLFLNNSFQLTKPVAEVMRKRSDARWFIGLYKTCPSNSKGQGDEYKFYSSKTDPCKKSHDFLMKPKSASNSPKPRLRQFDIILKQGLKSEIQREAVRWAVVHINTWPLKVKIPCSNLQNTDISSEVKVNGSKTCS